MRLPGRLRMWWARLRCFHHWHAADAMILWECCWCGADRDGMPKNLDENCRYDAMLL